MLASTQQKPPHFVTEYRDVIRRLLSAHPLNEAMSLAVGGDYDQIGRIETEILLACGLKRGDRVIDLGCGSGRLAKHLGIRLPEIDYLGIDIVQELTDYAASKSPAHFRFVLNYALDIPADNRSADFVAAFSVFTHLFHEESYAYLRDIRRVLRPGGKAIFTFLETERHWPIFQKSVGCPREGREMVMFMERPQMLAWARHLDMECGEFDPGPAIGQTVAVFRKPQ